MANPNAKSKLLRPMFDPRFFQQKRMQHVLSWLQFPCLLLLLFAQSQKPSCRSGWFFHQLQIIYFLSFPLTNSQSGVKEMGFSFLSDTEIIVPQRCESKRDSEVHRHILCSDIYNQQRKNRVLERTPSAKNRERSHQYLWNLLQKPSWFFPFLLSRLQSKLFFSLFSMKLWICSVCCCCWNDRIALLYGQLGGMKREPSLTFSLRGKHGREYEGEWESDEATTPTKIRKTSAFNRLMSGLSISTVKCDYLSGDQRSSSSGDESGFNLSPGTPPIYNHRNSSRRKGIPHRAPF